MSQPDPLRADANAELPAEVYLDDEALEQRRARRAHRNEVLTVPRLRMIGFQLVIATVVLHLLLVSGNPDWSDAALYAAIVEIYCIVNWLLLRRFHGRIRLDIATLFLLLDTVLYAGAVYVTGAHRSWLFPMVIVHAADSSGGTFKRVLAFAHFGVFCYAALVFIAALDPAAGLDWSTEIAKIAFLYGMAVYFSLTARVNERLTNQERESARVSRVLLSKLEANSIELRKRSEETQRALDLSRIASDTKDEFLANMTHELRTPLNAVIGFASVLLRKTADRLNAEEIDYLERIQSNGTHLLHIINDILDLSTLQGGNLPTEETAVDIRELARSVVGSFRYGLYAESLHLSLEAPDGLEPVPPDPKRLRQVLINVVGNAVKFTKSGSVRVRVVAQDRRPAVIEVIDTGIGIPAERLEAVFAPFEQADHRVGREFGGAGLGLSISRSLCELIGCRIEAESEVGKGSTFRILLPGAPTARR